MTAVPDDSYLCPNECCDVIVAWEIGKAVRRITLNGQIYHGMHALAVSLKLSNDGVRNRLKNRRCLQESKAEAYYRANGGFTRAESWLKAQEASRCENMTAKLFLSRPLLPSVSR